VLFHHARDIAIFRSFSGIPVVDLSPMMDYAVLRGLQVALTAGKRQTVHIAK
jgi:hypothetical protein